MARANKRRNDEEETGTPTRRAGMVFADWQTGRSIKKPGQDRGQRQEREEGRMAEGQTAQGFVRIRYPGQTVTGLPTGHPLRRTFNWVTPRLSEKPFWESYQPQDGGESGGE